MEIEAKFLVSDENIFINLKKESSIDSFNVTDKSEAVFKDTYLDTVDMVIHSSGYSFRCREKNDKVIYTLKSLKSADPLIHRREEIELVLSEKKNVENWKDSELKSLILNLIGSGKLFPLFYVSHTRTTGMLVTESREVAELSLDDVIISCDNNERSYLEVELELEENGTENELTKLVYFIEKDLGLVAGCNSKFDNGYEMILENIRNSAEHMGYSSSDKCPDTKALSISEMFDEYDIERKHARKVSENSLELFHGLIEYHDLSPYLIHTMKIAALVHDIGVIADVTDHHKAGRDILFQHSPAELPCPLCLMLPWTTFLHKKRIDPAKLEKLRSKKQFGNFSPKMQNDILKIAAILRLADGLDYSRMDSRIANIDLAAGDIIIEVKGSGAGIDSDRANTKADMWRLLFDRGIIFRPVT